MSLLLLDVALPPPCTTPLCIAISVLEKDDITARQPTYIYHISLLDIPSKEKQLTIVSKKDVIIAATLNMGL